jgi:hypothetical protein
MILLWKFRIRANPASQAALVRCSPFPGCHLRRLEGAAFSGASTAKTGFGLTSTSGDEYQFSFATMILTGNVWDT